MGDSALRVSLPPRIEAQEFRSRQDRARVASAARSLSGLVAWGRAGMTYDHYADLYYLSNFYSNFVVSPDPVPALTDPLTGQWSARGHGALIIPTDGPSTLVVDSQAYRDDLVVADEVVFSRDVVGATAAALKRAIPRGCVGIIGTDALAWRWYEGLVGVVGPRLIDADDIGPLLRLLKSDGELALLRAAADLGTCAVDALMDAATPGVTEAEVAAAGFHAVVGGGGVVTGMGLSCGPYAHMYCQSQPAPYDGRYVLREGDMARVDFYGSIDGYWFDIGRTKVIGSEPSDNQLAMINAARDSVLAGVEAVAPGVTLAEVARRCQEVYDSSTFARRGLAEPAIYCWGHSLGLAPEPPFIDLGSSTEIRPGMCLAIEKHIFAPGIGGATYEDDLVVTEDGCEVTSRAR
jgi:Xaa-Pro aminopeptidase